MYQYDKRLDFHALKREIKRQREAKGWAQDYLAQLVDRTPRSIIYIENRGQHPSLNTFYQLVTLLDKSVDQFFFPDKLNGESTCRKLIDVILNSMDEKELIVMESTAEGLKKVRGTSAIKGATSVFLRGFGGCTERQAIRVWAHSIFSRPSRVCRAKNSTRGRSPMRVTIFSRALSGFLLCSLIGAMISWWTLAACRLGWPFVANRHTSAMARVQKPKP